MGKWTKPDLFDLESDLLNNSIELISKKLYTKKIKKSYHTSFEKIPKFDPFLTFQTLENDYLE